MSLASWAFGSNEKMTKKIDAISTIIHYNASAFNVKWENLLYTLPGKAEDLSSGLIFALIVFANFSCCPSVCLRLMRGDVGKGGTWTPTRFLAEPTGQGWFYYLHVICNSLISYNTFGPPAVS